MKVVELPQKKWMYNRAMLLAVVSITLVMPSIISSAKDISAPPPVALLLLEFKKTLEGKPNTGRHGLKEYCYELDEMYVVYSQNLLGEGYSFLQEKPDLKCIVPKNNVSRTNQLGLTIGITQRKASSLLGFEIVDGFNRIVWHYQRPFDNSPYDDQTTLNITIKNGEVYAISIFNTVTN